MEGYELLALTLFRVGIAGVVVYVLGWLFHVELATVAGAWAIAFGFVGGFLSLYGGCMRY